MSQSKKIIDKIFENEKTIKEMAKAKTYTRDIIREHPGGMGGPIMGQYPRITSPTTKAALWGGAGNLTLSLLKTDVIDRRYIDKDHFTMQDLIDGALSEENKDINDMPLSGMTRPPFAVLDKRGGRYNHALWSEVYPFPCQKTVGQIIVKADELGSAEQPQSVHHMKDGSVSVSVEDGDKKLDVKYVMGMKRNVVAIDVKYENLEGPVSLRLYRNMDQGHRRYMEEDGTYKKVEVYRPADFDKPVEYYDFEQDKEINGLFEAPTCGSDDGYFWVHQIFPKEKTFPEGFRYVMMAEVADGDAEITEHSLAKGLGSIAHIPRDGQGMLKVPGIRTMTHPEMIEKVAEHYSHVAVAPGVAVNAELKAKKSGHATIFVSISTLNETEEYMDSAKKLIEDAKALGFEGLLAENEAWYDALYEKRENGRIVLGKTEEDKKETYEMLIDEVYQSWTSGHMGYCFPDPAKYEGSASYAGYEVDIQNWHSLPCYNELFTEGKFFMRNQYEPKIQWPQIVTVWHETLKEKAKLRFGLPGMYIAHGYLPAASQSPWYMENNSLDFTVEVPGQIMKVIWNFWDYTGDEKFLRETAYPLLRDLAIFYEAFARRGWDGKQFNLEPTVETESYGVSYNLEYTRNNTGALTMFRKVLNMASEAAEYLDCDADLISGWQEVAQNLAPYHTFMVNGGEVMGANEMAFPRYCRGDHFMFSGYYPINLADEITLDSPQETKDMMLRTADVLTSGRNWDPYILLGASKDYIPCKYAKEAIKITDYKTLAGDIIEAPERLMNSRSGRIHLFPSVPDWTVVSFRGFLARGGFEVSAVKDESGINAVSVKSRRSINCEIMNPWPGQKVKVYDTETGASTAFNLDTSNGECIVFATEAGHTYSIDKS